MATKTSESLKGILADSYVLYTKAQNFHWNVTGPHFHSLHALFEEIYSELAPAIDEIAERIRALGDTAPGTLKIFLESASIKEIEGVPAAHDMVKALADDHSALVKKLIEAREVAQGENDEASFDLLVERTQTHQKNEWMLRSSLPQ